MGKHIPEIAVGLVLAIVGVAITWNLAPSQEVRVQRAVEEAAKKAAAKEPPLRASASYDYADDDGYTFVLPTPLSTPDVDRLKAFRPIDEGYGTRFSPAERIAQENSAIRIAGGGMNSDRKGNTLTRIRLVLEGRQPGTVAITDISARILKRQPPLSGGLIFTPAEGENAIPTMGFDLDSSDLSAKVRAPLGNFARYSRSRFITLAQGEPIVISVFANTSSCYCEWVIDFKIRVDGRDTVVTVDDSGRPFRSTAMIDQYQSLFFWNQSVEPHVYDAVPSGRMTDIPWYD